MYEKGHNLCITVGWYSCRDQGMKRCRDVGGGGGGGAGGNRWYSADVIAGLQYTLAIPMTSLLCVGVYGTAPLYTRPAEESNVTMHKIHSS